ncbi:secondary thiamine-phosphate synthase enzyme YjbQ [Candidatus Woesearchaeota archaeon]|nr:secondary thiamine-phosphate synthase enzyme YjbQ [Candidatus Woesearchaeota archaeon]
MKQITVSTSKRQELVDITDDVKKIVKSTSVKNGVCSIFTPHATAAIMINENHDPKVCQDIIDCLNKLIPAGKWKHDRIDNNADSHIKSSIVGCSQTIPIKDSKLMLGVWQAIMLADFDGPRERTIFVNICEEK